MVDSDVSVESDLSSVELTIDQSNSCNDITNVEDATALQWRDSEESSVEGSRQDSPMPTAGYKSQSRISPLQHNGAEPTDISPLRFTTEPLHESSRPSAHPRVPRPRPSSRPSRQQHNDAPGNTQHIPSYRERRAPPPVPTAVAKEEAELAACSFAPNISAYAKAAYGTRPPQLAPHARIGAEVHAITARKAALAARAAEAVAETCPFAPTLHADTARLAARAVARRAAATEEATALIGVVHQAGGYAASHAARLHRRKPPAPPPSHLAERQSTAVTGRGTSAAPSSAALSSSMHGTPRGWGWGAPAAPRGRAGLGAAHGGGGGGAAMVPPLRALPVAGTDASFGDDGGPYDSDGNVYTSQRSAPAPHDARRASIGAVPRSANQPAPHPAPRGAHSGATATPGGAPLLEYDDEVGSDDCDDSYAIDGVDALHPRSAPEAVATLHATPLTATGHANDPGAAAGASEALDDDDVAAYAHAPVPPSYGHADASEWRRAAARAGGAMGGAPGGGAACQRPQGRAVRGALSDDLHHHLAALLVYPHGPAAPRARAAAASDSTFARLAQPRPPPPPPPPLRGPSARRARAPLSSRPHSAHPPVARGAPSSAPRAPQSAGPPHAPVPNRAAPRSVHPRAGEGARADPPATAGPPPSLGDAVRAATADMLADAAATVQALLLAPHGARADPQPSAGVRSAKAAAPAADTPARAAHAAGSWVCPAGPDAAVAPPSPRAPRTPRPFVPSAADVSLGSIGALVPHVGQTAARRGRAQHPPPAAAVTAGAATGPLGGARQRGGRAATPALDLDPQSHAQQQQQQQQQQQRAPPLSFGRPPTPTASSAAPLLPSQVDSTAACAGARSRALARARRGAVLSALYDVVCERDTRVVTTQSVYTFIRGCEAARLLASGATSASAMTAAAAAVAAVANVGHPAATATIAAVTAALGAEAAAAAVATAAVADDLPGGAAEALVRRVVLPAYRLAAPAEADVAALAVARLAGRLPGATATASRATTPDRTSHAASEGPAGTESGVGTPTRASTGDAQPDASGTTARPHGSGDRRSHPTPLLETAAGPVRMVLAKSPRAFAETVVRHLLATQASAALLHQIPRHFAGPPLARPQPPVFDFDVRSAVRRVRDGPGRGTGGTDSGAGTHDVDPSLLQPAPAGSTAAAVLTARRCLQIIASVPAPSGSISGPGGTLAGTANRSHIGLGATTPRALASTAAAATAAMPPDGALSASATAARVAAARAAAASGDATSAPRYAQLHDDAAARSLRIEAVRAAHAFAALRECSFQPMTLAATAAAAAAAAAGGAGHHSSPPGHAPPATPRRHGRPAPPDTPQARRHGTPTAATRGPPADAHIAPRRGGPATTPRLYAARALREGGVVADTTAFYPHRAADMLASLEAGDMADRHDAPHVSAAALNGILKMARARLQELRAAVEDQSDTSSDAPRVDYGDRPHRVPYAHEAEYAHDDGDDGGEHMDDYDADDADDADDDATDGPRYGAYRDAEGGDDGDDGDSSDSGERYDIGAVYDDASPPALDAALEALRRFHQL